MGTETRQKTFGLYALLLEEPQDGVSLYTVLTQSQIVEVRRDLSYTPVTQQEEYLLGVYEENDEIFPVFSPAILLGGKEKEKSVAQYIVLRTTEINPETGKNIQLIVASHYKLQLTGRAHLDVDLFEKSLPFTDTLRNTSMLHGMYGADEVHCVVLNLDKLAQHLMQSIRDAIAGEES